jgi:hypothetical protein
VFGLAIDALTEIGGTPLEHPPYSPDLATYDFWVQEVKTACSTILLKLAANDLQYVFESGWSVVRSASLAKGGTSKKRPSPHLQKVPTRINKVSPRIFEAALLCGIGVFLLTQYLCQI